MTRLNPRTLEIIAKEANGKFFHAGNDSDLARIIGEIAQMEKKDLGMSKLSTYEEQYQIFLAFALLLLLLEFLFLNGFQRKRNGKAVLNKGSL